MSNDFFNICVNSSQKFYKNYRIEKTYTTKYLAVYERIINIFLARIYLRKIYLHLDKKYAFLFKDTYIRKGQKIYP